MRDCGDASPSLAGTHRRLAENGNTHDAHCAIRAAGRKTAMTEIDSALDPFVQAETKDYHAALIREMVAVGIIICFLFMLIGLHQ
jgi:hypothetical protein